MRSAVLLGLWMGWGLTATAQPGYIDTLRGTLPPDLVNVGALDATLRLDVRYARAENFLGKPLYLHPVVYLQRPAAEALLRVHNALKAKGYGLLLFDGYRPWSITKRMWDECAPIMRYYLAPPLYGSIHNRGCSIDCSLYDLKTGLEVTMPSAYDEPTERASATYTGGTPAQRAARDLLIAAMRAEGFFVQPNEWWHFNYHAWRRYPILDIPLWVLVHSQR